MHAAHDAQMDMISSEAKGSSVDLSLILVHAEDHLTMAIVTSDLAARMVELYRRLAASATRFKVSPNGAYGRCSD